MNLLHRWLPPIALVSALATNLVAQSPDWPQWRGPGRNGVVPSFAAPRVWPDELTLRWKVDVGEGYATPVLVGDRVYMFTRQGEDEVMLALDVATGEVRWRTSYAAPFTLNPAAVPHGPGPKSTPTFANGRLYTLGMSGIVTCFDAGTGRQIWQKPAPPVGPLYGTAMSALVDNGRVILHVGGHDDGALTAFDAATGDVIWSWDGDGPSYASPFLAEIDGVRQVINLTQDHVVGVSPDDGELLWSRPFSTGFTQNVIDPVLDGRTVIVAGFQESVSAFDVVRRGGQWVTEDAWVNDEVSQYMTNGVRVGDALFGLSSRNSGQYFLLDVGSGETLWRGLPRQAENAAIVRAGDLLFVLQDDAELMIGRAGRAGFEVVASYTVADSATWAQPTISGDRIFVKDVSTLTLWSLN